MKRICLSFCLSLLALPITGAPREDSLTGQVVRVHDGDTVSLQTRQGRVKLRLYGIDCPEIGQARGEEARRFTSDAVLNRTVSVRRMGRDRYKRTLGWVSTPQGEDLNAMLVRDGWAWTIRKLQPARQQFEPLELAARRSRRGLWADRDPVAPWTYRHTRKSRGSNRREVRRVLIYSTP